jgi:hypothetical protein
MFRATINLQAETRNALRHYGKKAQTYDDIVKELLKKVEALNR